MIKDVLANTKSLEADSSLTFLACTRISVSMRERNPVAGWLEKETTSEMAMGVGRKAGKWMSIMISIRAYEVEYVQWHENEPHLNFRNSQDMCQRSRLLLNSPSSRA